MSAECEVEFAFVSMPLDAENERALAGELARKHGRHTCPCQPELRAFLVSRGVGVTEL